MSRPRKTPTDEHAGPRSWEREWSVARRAGTLKELISVMRLAARDDARAMAFLAMLYREGVKDNNGKSLLRRDARRSLSYARRGAEAGDSGALFELATQLDSSMQAANVREARRIYLRLARLGDTSAMFNLAVTHRQQGDHGRALRWFRKAASVGHGSAQIEVAKATYLGVGTRRRAPEALRELLSLAAEERLDVSPYAREQCFIWVARAVLDGWCTPREHAQACGYLRAAAALGSLTAQAMLDEI